jgi:two-component sensor histidine kinase
MTNSFKHAVLPNKDLEIRVEMIARGENQFELIYQDNGPGLIRDAQSHVSESLGMRLIFGLTKQINGEVLFERKEGLCVNIRFSTEIS